MPECYDCEDEFGLAELICANTSSDGDDCDCDECELYCNRCFEDG